MSSPPGRRAAPKSSGPEGEESTRPTRLGGRRASEPTTGTLPVINAPLLGDEETSGGGRRIRAVAPVSSAPEQGDRRVVRSFDHTGEIPAVQVVLPEPEPVEDAASTAVGTDPATTPADTAVDLPPAWTPTVGEVASSPVPADPTVVQAAAADLARETAAVTPRRGRRAKDVPVDSESDTSTSLPVVPPVEALPEEAAPAALLADEAVAVKAPVKVSRRDRRRALRALDAAAAEPDPEPLSRVLAAEAQEVTGLAPEALTGLAEPLPDAEPEATSESSRRRFAAGSRLGLWSGVLLVGVVLLAMAALHIGPSWLDGAGAVAVLTTFCWAAAARTGGRQVVFSTLGFAIGVAALLVDGSVLRSGAAVMTCVTSGVVAVVLTVPAKNFLVAVREVVVATAIASIGAFATIGFEPVASTSRFELLTLIIGMGVMVALVWRFAAGLHGLGTRGLVIVVVGTVLLAASQLYAELLRSYGEGGVMGPTSDMGEWMRDTIGASPRMIMVLLGVPALVWGVHMRARRRQGWWVCTFGAAATLPVAQRLVNLETSYVEAGLQTFYSVALGCLVGWLLITLDQRLTGPRGARAAGDGGGLRPEPRRFSSL